MALLIIEVVWELLVYYTGTTLDIFPHLTWNIFDIQTFWKLFLYSGICNLKTCVLGPIDQINFCPWRIFLNTILFRMTGIYPVHFQASSAGCFCLYRWVHWSQLPRFRTCEFIALPLMHPHMTLLGRLLHFLSFWVPAFERYMFPQYSECCTLHYSGDNMLNCTVSHARRL
jgi:hypothetical protein